MGSVKIMKGNDLREYVKRVYILERTLYEQKTLLNYLNWEIDNYSKDAQILDTVNNRGNYNGNAPYKNIQSEKRDTAVYFDSEYFLSIFFWSVIIGFIALIVHAVVNNVTLTDIFTHFFTPLFSELWFGIKVAFFVFIISVAIYAVINLIRYLSNRSKRKKENLDIQKYNVKIIERNKDIFAQRQIQKKNMIAEANYVRNVSIRKIQETLNQLYSMDVIFPKYRKLVAVSSFYEYFESGRCATLTGHEGAYNIYENEIRLNHIIQQLDEVIEKLDEIKNNQYMLYDAIKESQRQSNKIVKEIKAIKNQNVDIMQNTGVAAYNSSIIAQNTDVIKWYQVLYHYFQ